MGLMGLLVEVLVSLVEAETGRSRGELWGGEAELAENMEGWLDESER